MNITPTLPNYKAKYDFLSSDSIDLIQVEGIDAQTSRTLTDSNKYESRQSRILFKINALTTGLNWNFSSTAFDNAIEVFTKAYQAKLVPKMIDHLENDEGIFMDFTRADAYFAFELYNDGGIITIKKIGDQNSIIGEPTSVDQIVF